MGYELSGKTVVVTGAAGGIGGATASELLRRGARVVLADLHEPAVAPGERVLTVKTDVTDRASLDALVQAAVERFGGIDVVFANAGIAMDPPTTILGADPAAFEKVLEVDLLGVWRTISATLPQVAANGGYVLVTSSIYAYINGVINAAYATSKSGIEALTRALRVELRQHGAAAGVVYPGWVRTPLADVAFGKSDAATRMRERAFPWPFDRAVAPEKVAKAVADGMERRAARIHVPRIWAPYSGLRGVINPLIDTLLERDQEIQRNVKRLENGQPSA